MSWGTRRKAPAVVVGESEYLTARLLIAALQSAGYSAVSGRTGDEIMGLVQKHEPEAVVLNLNLVRPNGIELLRSLTSAFPGIQILAATAAGQAEMKAAAAALGVSAFFELPFSPTQLIRSVAALKEQNGAAAPVLVANW